MTKDFTYRGKTMEELTGLPLQKNFNIYNIQKKKKKK